MSLVHIEMLAFATATPLESVILNQISFGVTSVAVVGKTKLTINKDRTIKVIAIKENFAIPTKPFLFNESPNDYTTKCETKF